MLSSAPSAREAQYGWLCWWRPRSPPEPPGACRACDGAWSADRREQHLGHSRARPVGPRPPREATVTETEIHAARVILTLEENCNKFLTRNCIWQESARTPVLIIHHF